VLDYLFALEIYWKYIEDESQIISEKICVFSVKFSGLEKGYQNRVCEPPR
jgi:hypothetical protein